VPSRAQTKCGAAESLHADRETAFEGGLIAEKDRDCRFGEEASCLDRITYRKLMR
jgi:hypothetical protein